MIVVITGNIGCGKSTATKMLAMHLNTDCVYDYDYTVAMLYQDELFQSQLTDLFSTTDKATISDIVFKDRSKLLQLRTLTRPRLDQSLVRFIAKHQRQHMVFDIPLWFEDEMNLRFGCDRVVTIVADESNQIERVQTRSGWSEEKIRSVIGNQLAQVVKMEMSDYAVPNDSTLIHLNNHMQHLAKVLLNEEIEW